MLCPWNLWSCLKILRLNRIRTLTTALPVQCYTSWAIRPTKSQSSCGSIIGPHNNNNDIEYTSMYTDVMLIHENHLFELRIETKLVCDPCSLFFFSALVMKWRWRPDNFRAEVQIHNFDISWLIIYMTSCIHVSTSSFLFTTKMHSELFLSEKQFSSSHH